MRRSKREKKRGCRAEARRYIAYYIAYIAAAADSPLPFSPPPFTCSSGRMFSLEYRVRQLLSLVERYNLSLGGEE